MQPPLALAARTLRLALCSIFTLVVMAAFAAGNARAAAPVATDVSAGKDHTCAVIDAAAWCWGDNTNGQLGDGTTTDRSTPAKVAFADPAPTITKVSAGYIDSCALDSSGAVWCWGDNTYGQLGVNNSGDGWADVTTPVKVDFGGSPPTITQISVGTWHTCAVDSAGKAWCWGHNGSSRLGIGSGDNDPHPAPVTPTGLESSVRWISAGASHSCASVDQPWSSTKLQCWGANDRGQLGVNDKNARNVPTDVINFDGTGQFATYGVIVPAAGDEFTCASLGLYRNVYCWGRNITADPLLAPAEFLLPRGLLAFADKCSGTSSSCPEKISAGAGHACSIETDKPNGVSCWGASSKGQLGDGRSVSSPSTPRTAIGLEGATAVSAGGIHSCALISGWIKCWGDGSDGRIGDGTATGRLSPTAVVFPAGVKIADGIDGSTTVDDHINVAFLASGHPEPVCRQGGRRIDSGDPVALQPRDNVIEITCANDTSSASAAVTVTRNVPAQASNLSASAGAQTTAAATTLTWGVSGYPTPTCKVNGITHTSGESFSLVEGVNDFSLSCSNVAGTDDMLLGVTRNTPPSIDSFASSEGSPSEATATTLTWTTGGYPTPTCKVNGVEHTSGVVLALDPGVNDIGLVCENGVEPAATASVSLLTLGPPVITSFSSSEGLEFDTADATETTFSWTVIGHPAPTCKLNDVPRSSGDAPTWTPLGPTTYTLVCSNGIEPAATASIVVTRFQPALIFGLTPTAGWTTTDAFTHMTWTVSGYPAATCTARGTEQVSGERTFGLDPGVNTITVTCSNGYGPPGSSTVLVTRNVPTQISSATAANGAETGDATTRLSWTTTGYPAATSCTVDGDAHASGDHDFTLAPGPNTFELVCSNGAGSPATRSIEVTRNVAPSVTIDSPQNAFETTDATVPVDFTAAGHPAPTCKIDNAEVTSGGAVQLDPGVNTITVTCSNGYGSSGSAAVLVTRNVPTQITSATAANGAETGDATTRLGWTTTGYPSVTSCTVGGDAHASGDHDFALAPGPNTFELICSNGAGSPATRSIEVTRNVSPSVTIDSPQNGFETTDATVPVDFTVGGYPEPTCKIDDTEVTSGGAVQLTVGPNFVTVSCSNTFGGSTHTANASRLITRVAVPQPGTGGPTGSTGSTGPGTSAPTASAKPAITEAPKRVKLGKSIKVKVSCAAGCEVVPRLMIGKKRVGGIARVSLSTGADHTTVRLPKKVVRQIKRSIKKHGHVKVMLRLTPSLAGQNGAARWIRIG